MTTSGSDLRLSPELQEEIVSILSDVWEEGRAALTLKRLTSLVRSALVEGRQPQGWHPIETAPKDGTPILACCVHRKLRLGQHSVVWWRAEFGDWYTPNIQPFHAPTHWQPLPPLPASPSPSAAGQE